MTKSSQAQGQIREVLRGKMKQKHFKVTIPNDALGDKM